MTPLPPLAVTMGEPAGIGGEILLRAWLRREEAGGLPAFFAIDDPARLEETASRLGLAVPVRAIAAAAQAGEVFGRALPVLALGLPVSAPPGRPLVATAGAVIAAIERAVGAALAGEAAAVVTNPIHKETLYVAGFPFPGHTEFLAEIARRHGAGEAVPVMMLVADDLRVVPVTVHLPLRDAIAALSRELIVSAGRIAAASLARDFGIAEPRLAVAALNPHAGEGGRLGREEIEVIAPAIDELRALGIDASGPWPADSLFHEVARRRFDAALCMYHDQALIPLKTLAFHRGVNVTLGLPFVRTSPDHGTALDIAGQGRADESSLVAALRLAAAIAARRRAAAKRARVA